VLGSGTGGKLIAWTMAKEGKRTAVVEREYIGGSCPNIACLPSKNFIHTAKVASLMGRHQEFGIQTESTVVDMAGVYTRKRKMVDEIVQIHLDRYQAAGDELLLGEGRFIEPRTLRVSLRGGGERTLTADRVFINTGTHATIPAIPGLGEAKPMTHVEMLDLHRLPKHLIVLGGGYVGMELGQTMRRLGSRVTLIELGPRLASSEDSRSSWTNAQYASNRFGKCGNRSDRKGAHPCE
jgi:pyruvate/2-oxoglutarate dehydrogenase complex dihydrolipoamide dehydrogenase (E3) component